MEMATNKRFTEFWKTLTTSERDQLTIVLAKKCNVSLTTVPYWGRAQRNPKIQSQEIITAYLRTQGHEVDQKTLFPD